MALARKTVEIPTALSPEYRNICRIPYTSKIRTNRKMLSERRFRFRIQYPAPGKTTESRAASHFNLKSISSDFTQLHSLVWRRVIPSVWTVKWRLSFPSLRRLGSWRILSGPLLVILNWTHGRGSQYYVSDTLRCGSEEI